jgi:putative IMPACT (imprinted ancient) family translation regulator
MTLNVGSSVRALSYPTKWALYARGKQIFPFLSFSEMKTQHRDQKDVSVLCYMMTVHKGEWRRVTLSMELNEAVLQAYSMQIHQYSFGTRGDCASMCRLVLAIMTPTVLSPILFA